jgi:hypothetical protein
VLSRLSPQDTQQRAVGGCFLALAGLPGRNARASPFGGRSQRANYPHMLVESVLLSQVSPFTAGHTDRYSGSAVAPEGGHGGLEVPLLLARRIVTSKPFRHRLIGGLTASANE